jgi:magnesium chelatase subunit H
MTPKRTTVADATPVRVVVVTLDRHVAGALDRARAALAGELPGLDLRLHAATDFADPAAAAACRDDVMRGDVVFANMLFLEEHVRAVLPALEARREACDAMVCAMSAGDVMRQTRMGDFRMDGSAKGPLALLKKLRGSRTGGGAKDGGAGQMAMLRTLPRLLRFVPGKAQDLRTYFLTLQYWLSGSGENLADLVRLLVGRYARGPRAGLRGALAAAPPREYPEVGVYHPRLPGRMAESAAELPGPADARGAVGLLLLRSYVVSGDAGHYDAVIAALEARGLRAVPAFAAGLDARPAVERFFVGPGGRPTVDAVVSLTGFSLVGGPAFNDAKAAEEVLARLDVPYVAAQPLEFQSVEQWQASPHGLSPFETAIMLAIPELDGATGPIVFGGRRAAAAGAAAPMGGIDERVATLAARVDGLVRNRQTPRGERNVAVVLFNFPPNAGAAGTAAHLSVFASLYRTLEAMRAGGYDVEVPGSVEELTERVLGGNAAQYGAEANVHAKVSADEHVRRERHLAEIERAWGPAPGTKQSDGSSIFVLGARFGRVFVGLQPAFGYEGDPMRLLFEGSFAPTHAFSAFYRYLREDFGAHAVLHFGTHGALEFMPGKQAGLSGDCWPDRLVGDVPNVYLYAANNPSDGARAGRRAAATLVSYLTPPVTQAGLYRGLLALRESLDRRRALPPGDPEAARLLPLIQAQAAELDLAPAEPPWAGEAAERALVELGRQMRELEEALIPCGLHVVGEPMPPAARADYLAAIAEGTAVAKPPRAALDVLVAGGAPAEALRRAGLPRDETNLALYAELARVNALLSEDHELPALLRALDGKYTRPAPGGDLLRNPAVLPTGRNVHGFDPFAIPSAFAVLDGAQQAARLLARHVAEGNPLPESVALVLWGADNLKSGGGPIAQALALMGARPRLDSYGRLAGAELVPLAELGRPRIDVLITLSGIFRDLLPLQTRLLAEAAYLAAGADEPLDQNFVRRHALAHQSAHGCDLETAALRVFSNAEGAYGSNVNLLVDGGTWGDEAELGDAYAKRKCYAYGRSGAPARHEALLQSVLSGVDLAYQNLESVELGVTTLDHYFDTLGGIGRAARAAKGGAAEVAVYVGDQTGREGRVRTLKEQVSLESRTRSLNPKWAEGMLEHGAEGVRQIEAHVTNTFGWSATTGQVEPWVYRELAETYVLDRSMRERLARLNPKASLRVANRLLEATERDYWRPDEATLAALRAAGEELEDRLEGLSLRAPAAPPPLPAPRPAAVAAAGPGAHHERPKTHERPRSTLEARARRRRRGQRAVSPRAARGHRGGEGVRRLRQGGHRQEHDVVEPVGGVRQAGQARLADRVRPEARLDLHADQAAAADGHRRARVGRVPRRRVAPRRLRRRGLRRGAVRRGRGAAGRHRLRRLRGRADGQAAEGAPAARRDRRGHLRRARRRGVRGLRRAAAARAAGARGDGERLRLDLRDEPHRRRDRGEGEELRGAPRRRHRQPQRGHRRDRPLQRAHRARPPRALRRPRRGAPQPAQEVDPLRDGVDARARRGARRVPAARRPAVGRHRAARHAVDEGPRDFRLPRVRLTCKAPPTTCAAASSKSTLTAPRPRPGPG